MNKKLIIISILVFLLLASGGFFLYNQVLLNSKFMSKDLKSDNKKNTEQLKISEKIIYQNNQLGLELNYPKEWNYREIPPEPVTSQFKTYNPSTKKYEHTFVKELTDFVIAFGASDILMPSATRGGDGFITINIFNGSMEELFDREITRNTYYNSLIQQGKKSLDDVKKEFLGEKIILNKTEGYKVTRRNKIPDALNDYPVEEIKIEKNNKVFLIKMENIYNKPEVNTVFQEMLHSLKFEENK